MIKDNALNLDFSDEIIGSTCVAHGHEIRNSRVREALEVVGGKV
jgi:NAD(P) transhydrogenase subunit alpha